MAHTAAGSGILGEDAKKHHDRINHVLEQAGTVIVHHPGVALDIAREFSDEAAQYAQDHPGYFVGRLGMSHGFGRFTGTGVRGSIGITTLVVYGNAIDGAQIAMAQG